MRRYAFQAAADGLPVAVAEQAPRPKPPGCTLRGSMLEMTVQLQHPPGQQSEAASSGISDAQRYLQQLLAGSGPGAAGGDGGVCACLRRSVR